MVILKGQMEKMETRYKQLEKMQDALASQLEALSLEVCEAQDTVHRTFWTYAPPQTPTLLQSLPGIDMIPIPTTSQVTDPQPGTSGQGQFPAGTPQLPIPPPVFLNTHKIS